MSSRKKVLILTQAFPFYPGEQFLEDEIGYWANLPHTDVYLIPMTASGSPRTIPSGIEVDVSITLAGKFDQIIAIIRTITSRLLRNEIVILFKNNEMSLSKLLIAFHHATKIHFIESKIAKFVSREGKVDLVYSYWNDDLVYAACLAKKNGHVTNVTSRAHGFDLYEERRRYHYMPFKRQLATLFDLVMTLSEEGADYFSKTYKFPLARIDVSPLGVPIPEKVSEASSNGFLHVVSVAFCTKIKRIDKICDALGLFACENPRIHVEWTHIGGGPLLEMLKQKGAEVMQNASNLKCQFTGNLKKCDVSSFYEENSVDFIMNTSEFEGVPVSLMEAMSYGVPAMATDVGGVPHLVTPENGVLLDVDITTIGLANAIRSFAEVCKETCKRNMAKTTISKSYNAANNYPSAISRILSVARK